MNASLPAPFSTTLRDVDRYWRTSGVPRSERRDRIHELRTHLEDAAAQGRGPEDVVGPDALAFAAEWILADRRHPWASAALRFVGMLAVGWGAVAVLFPHLPGVSSAPGIQTLGMMSIPALSVLGKDVTQMNRGRLGRRRVAALALAAVLVAGAGGAALGYLQATRGPVVEVSAGAGAALVLVGVVALVIAWRLRLTPRGRASGRPAPTA
ncbi:hypothetical protein [Actinotalea sp. K2]|uniref:hypothetical protein n=1 Tax=Actinotalea sp. K2 TaxID=2939438 RepID=UPI002017EB70|nr:hypothetical protein [Actinotalea sp. K2]MCL3860980.1 hypothetical protein [Actinotalea sp. K2]